MDKLTSFLSSLSEEQKALFISALQTPEVPEVEPQPKKKGRPKKIIIPDEDVTPEPHKPKVVKIPMEKDGSTTQRIGNRPISDTLARPEPVVLGSRKNMFDTFEEFNADKHLVEEDKKNWSKTRPTPRNKRATLYEVQCIRCNQTFQVGAGLAHSRYVCDRCIPAKGN